MLFREGGQVWEQRGLIAFSTQVLWEIQVLDGISCKGPAHTELFVLGPFLWNSGCLQTNQKYRISLKSEQVALSHYVQILRVNYLNSRTNPHDASLTLDLDWSMIKAV